MKKILFVLLLLPLFGRGQIITTIAGNGASGSTGDGGPATAAEISIPGSGAFDMNGNYYFSQRYNNIVSKVTPSGIISVAAGNGTAGYSGDNGPATAAGLNNPQGIAIDLSGNLYIADINNSVIRKVVLSTGGISTYAGNGTATENGDGGPAISAGIFGPLFVCVDAAGNLYISDDDNRIRKVNVAKGVITTVAGKGGAVGFSGDNGAADSAQLHGPTGICTDTLGNLFIADYYNDRIRKVNVATGIITTIAGGSSGTYNGEGLIDTAARLNPSYVCFDVYGNLYVADEGNNRVRRIDTTGHIYTIAGNGSGAYNGDNIAATAAEIFHPIGIAFDPCGNLYIADEDNNRIRKVIFNPTCSPEEVNNIAITNNFTIFPNPATTQLTIQSTAQPITQITITNLLGQTVYSQLPTAIPIAIGSQLLTVDVSALPTGMYFVKVNDTEVRQFLKE